eukprot:6973999-Alexandrium_andersonii.AAC.1
MAFHVASVSQKLRGIVTRKVADFEEAEEGRAVAASAMTATRRLGNPPSVPTAAATGSKRKRATEWSPPARLMGYWAAAT